MEKRKEKFKKDIEENLEIDIFLLEYQKKKIGLLILNSCKNIKENKNCAEIIAIYLLPEFWHCGLGEEMMKFSLERFRNFSAKEIVIWVLEKNTKARKFYEKFGFLPSGNKKILKIENAIEIEYKLCID